MMEWLRPLSGHKQELLPGEWWTLVAICVGLVTFSGLMSGLTLGLMSLDAVDMEVRRVGMAAMRYSQALWGLLQACACAAPAAQQAKGPAQQATHLRPLTHPQCRCSSGAEPTERRSMQLASYQSLPMSTSCW